MIKTIYLKALRDYNFNTGNLDIIKKGELLEVHINDDVKYYLRGKFVGWDKISDNIMDERYSLFVSSTNIIRKEKLNRLKKGYFKVAFLLYFNSTFGTETIF